MSYQNKKLQALSHNIKALREMKGLRQKDMAKQLGVSQSTVCMWEKGRSKPTAEDILTICYTYQISADVLLGIPKQWKKIK